MFLSGHLVGIHDREWGNVYANFEET